MLRVLLAKDLRRAWRNPLPWLINLAVPLCITALIGLTFGGGSDNTSLGRIRFAVVDEDDSPLSGFLRGAANQSEGGKYLEPVFLDRAAALREITDNKLSAALIIPKNFMRDYLTGRGGLSLELIKNPAQSIHPAVLEEMLSAVVTGLNAVARNFQSEFPEWQAVFDGQRDYHKIATLIERAGNKIQAVRKFVNPPLVTYEREVRAGESKGGPPFNLFAYLLAGMSAMFLLFLASNALGDLQREVAQRTFERYHTMQQRLFPFVAGKVVFAVVFLLWCSAVMLGGGALIFRISWQQPLALLALTLGYAFFAAGCMAFLVTWITDEHRSAAIVNLVSMILGVAGGCTFPPQQLPAFFRDHLSPLLPTYWYAETVRSLQSGGANVPWVLVSLKLASVSALLLVLAALLFRRRFQIGSRT